MDKNEDKDNRDPKFGPNENMDIDKDELQEADKTPDQDSMKEKESVPSKDSGSETKKDGGMERDMHPRSGIMISSESEGIGTKRTFSGNVIHVGFESKGTKKAKEEEKRTDFKYLRALFKKHVDIKFVEFDEKTIRFINEDKSIQGLEAKIHALLCQDDDKDFKNDKIKSKKCFLEWLKEFDGSDADKETLKSLKNRAIVKGVNLSRALVDIMFFMSYEKYEEMLETFLVLEASLEWVLKGETSVVIHRILEILQTADIKLRNKKHSEMVDNPSAGKEVITLEIRGSFTDDMIFRLLKEIFRLELFWVHQGLPDSKDSLMGVIPSLAADIIECETVLIEVAAQIRDSVEIWLFGVFEAEELRETPEYEAVDAKIDQLWEKVEDYDKENGRKRY
ncbi:conserved hypothetical protein [Ricinus communis]|uniref:Uncharacterized protein n=1 Tax=Ricinus communis TaxID=3988 RepID=B9SXM1_RICCO|nr:conserved hypothetical protein [Ricinus communis]